MLIWLSFVAATAFWAGARPVPPCEGDFTIDRPALYRMVGQGRVSHLLGVAQGDEGLAHLSGTARAAVDAAEVAVFETRLRAWVPPAATARRLSDALSDRAWRELTSRLAQKGLAAWTVDVLSPALAYHLLQTDAAELEREGLDREVRRVLVARGTRLHALESAARQERLAEAAMSVGELEQVLLSGAPPADGRELADLRSGEPVRYQRLLAGRHRAWVPKILARHRRRGRTLFVLNRLHLGGPDGLLALLAARGYDLRRVD